MRESQFRFLFNHEYHCEEMDGMRLAIYPHNVPQHNNNNNNIKEKKWEM